MDREYGFWGLFAVILGGIVVMSMLIFGLLNYMLKDVTIESIAEDFGRAATSIGQAYERGKTGDRQ